MNSAKIPFLLLLVTCCACYGDADPDEALIQYDFKRYPLANDLSDASYSPGDSWLAFSYTGDRVTEVSFKNKTQESPYMTVNYLNRRESKIRSVHYHRGAHLSDTLYYTGINLTKIISTFEVEEGKDQYTIETNFTYGLLGLLQKANNGARKVELLEYVGWNVGRMKYYEPNLRLDIQSIKYDGQPSPFAKLGYLNLVFFANNNLEGLRYLGSNNVTECVTDEYQGKGYTIKYGIEHSYNSKGRPVRSAARGIDGSGYREDFYDYND